MQECVEHIPSGFQTPPVLKAFERLLAENRRLVAELERVEGLLKEKEAEEAAHL